MGKLAYEVAVRTAAAHSSLSHSKPSAITSAIRLIGVLDELQHHHRPVGDPEVTFNCGTINGGSGLNVIAERCTFAFEVRHTVDHDPDAVSAAVHGCRRSPALGAGGSSGLDRAHRDHPLPGVADARSDPWLRLVERIADAGPAILIGYGTEGGLFAEALDVPVVICGPGDIAVAHRPDEYVTIDQLLRCERFLGGLVEQVCVDSATEG